MIEQHARDWFSKVLVDILIMMDRDDIQIIEPSASMTQDNDDIITKDGKRPIGPMEWHIEFKTVKIKPSNEMREFIFELGEAVEDKVSGFKGIVTAQIRYHLGGTRYMVTQATVKKNEKAVEEWFDEPRLKHSAK